MLSFLLLLGGIGILIVGGELLVRGSVALAGRMRVGPVIVGMTVVAFGTSTPELVVNIAAALRGDSAIGFGNVVGSNIANIGLLLAVTAIAYPIVVHRSVISREIPMMVLASLAVVVLGLNSIFDGEPDRFARGEGLMLLLLFCVFLYYTLADALQQRDNGLPIAMTEQSEVDASSRSTWLMAAMIGSGLIVLIAGGMVTVRGGVGVAQALGMPEVFIGLTLVAVGTSLPELATTLSAARRGHTDMAIGNIVGSNIFNLLFIWGISTTLAPTDLPAGGGIDLLVMTGFAVVLLPVALTRRKVTRLEGGVFFVAYAVYMLWLTLR